MDNRTALILALIVMGALVADLVMDWGATTFLTSKILDVIGWMAFWR